MKKTLILSLLLMLALPMFGQVTMIPTTLSAAATSSSTTVVVAAATGLNSNSYSIAAGSSYLYIDGELLSVTKVSGTTLSVVRGYGGSRAMSHVSGALVFVGPANFFSASGPGLLAQGACTRSSIPALPRPVVQAQVIQDCIGGVWVTGDNSNAPVQAFWNAPNVGGTLYTGINTNGTTLSANTQYCTEIDLPYNMFVTGLGVLNGTTASTDAHAVALYDAKGNLLYQSAKAGATASGASAFQTFAFTLNGNGSTISKAYLVGPARYFGCMQTNGTTATVRMAVTGQADNVLTTSVGSITLGTFSALTVPTTFTTAVGPFFRLY